MSESISKINNTVQCSKLIKDKKVVILNNKIKPLTKQANRVFLSHLKSSKQNGITFLSFMTQKICFCFPKTAKFKNQILLIGKLKDNLDSKKLIKNQLRFNFIFKKHFKDEFYK